MHITPNNWLRNSNALWIIYWKNLITHIHVVTRKTHKYV